MAVIELEHISFCYEAHGQSFQALDDLNVTIRNGEFVCILGRSGCGKTTLLRLLAGLQMPTRGQVRIDERPVTGPGLDRAVVFQSYTLFPWMTARENILFGIRQARKDLSRRQAQETAEYFLREVDMQDAADAYPCRMSGGMRQRVAIARALAMDPDILLLDEPFGALDARIRRELQELLTRLWGRDGGKRKTVVFVTHDLHEAASLASRILYMSPGRITADLPGAADGGAALEQELMALFYQDGRRDDAI